MSIVTYKRGDKTALTKNFTRDEFECQCKKCDAQLFPAHAGVIPCACLLRRA